MVLPTSYAAQNHQERAESQGGQWWSCNNNSRVLQILEAVEELLADDTSLINNDGSDSAFPGTSNFGSSVLATEDGGGDNSRRGVLLLVVQPVPPPSSIARSTAHESSTTRGRHDHHAPPNPFRTRIIPVTTRRRNWSEKRTS